MNCAGNCLTTADWHQLIDEDAWRVVACPKEIPLGTKIYIEDYWTVTCHDRWWAIKKTGSSYHIDIRAWAGMTWLNNIEQNIVYNPWTRKGYLIY